MPTITVAILNFNGQSHLKQFLPSIINHNDGYEIAIIDNGSTDNSIAFLKENFSSVKLILLNKNLGYTGGYNEGLKQIDSDYFVLMNSDVEVTHGWFKPLLTKIISDKRIVAVQPKVKSYANKNLFEYAGAAGGYIDWLGYPFCKGRIFDTLEEDNGQYDKESEIFWATGACMLINANAFFEIGGFDTDFFVHMEEIDLCWRLKNKGYTVWVVPESTIYHLGGGTLNKSNPKKTFYNYRNSLAMVFKNLPMKYVPFNIFTRLVLDGISAIRLFFKGNFSDVWAILKAHFSFYAMVPSLLKKRGDKFTNVNYIYARTIVKQYFYHEKTKFSELEKINNYVESWTNRWNRSRKKLGS